MIILKIIGIVFGTLIIIILTYLIIVIFAPGFNVPKQPISIAESSTSDTMDKGPSSRKDVSFTVEGSKVSAWLYLPLNTSSPVPCVVMNHGFGGIKDKVLESYALQFQEAGIAALAYDYRYFGESEGEPRQLFSIPAQLKDSAAAIDYARSIEEIDPDKIAIWGTSAGGGYGLVHAANDKKIVCAIAQCAALDREKDGKNFFKRVGIRSFLRLFMHAQRDKGRSRFGLSPHRIPIVGKPGTIAFLEAPGAFDGYSKLIAFYGTGNFINEVCARALLTGAANPIDYAKDVRCPVLIQICEKDNLVSMDSALKTAKILGEYAEVKRYPIEHFEIYLGEHFEKSVDDQITFLKKHLKS